VRWLERQGYDVSYWTGVDADRYAERLAKSAAHKLYVSVGHDEYWSGPQRAAVEAARDRGMHLAFLSGNEVFWRTRWEEDTSGASHRTLVVYKDTQSVAKLDPEPGEWTGTWRDGRAINPLGAAPENALTGTIFTVNAWRNDPLLVPARYGAHRFWRNTSVAAAAEAAAEAAAAGGGGGGGEGEVTALVQGLLGHEWDEDIDNGHRPPGLQHLSETVVDNVQYIFDEGAHYDTGTGTHHLTLYRHAGSGALVFGAGTPQWSWGLDGHHDLVGGIDLRVGANCYSLRVGADLTHPSGNRDIQQATTNLLADMGVVPATPQGGVVVTAASADAEAPSVAPQAIFDGTVDASSISGAAEDSGGGIVAAVEVLLPGSGGHWHPASVHLGDGSWHFTPPQDSELGAKMREAAAAAANGQASDAVATMAELLTVKVRAADDSGNMCEPAEVSVMDMTEAGITVAAEVSPAGTATASASPTSSSRRRGDQY